MDLTPIPIVEHKIWLDNGRWVYDARCGCYMCQTSLERRMDERDAIQQREVSAYRQGYVDGQMDARNPNPEEMA